MTTDLRALTAEFNRSAWAISAIAIAAERGVLSAIAERPLSCEQIALLASIAVPTARALADVLAALGVVAIEADGNVHDVGALAAYRDLSAAKLLAADLRSTLGTVRDAAYAEGAIEGWRAIDPVAVRAQGFVSHAMTLSLAPMLRSIPDMHARLSAPGARFLDVGAGAAGLAIAFATLYPSLHVVGMEPSEIACAEGRAAIQLAGLSDRVELRCAYGQDLQDEAAFVSANVAQMFVPDAAIEGVWRATARALQPGAWLTTGAIAIDGTDLAPSIARFRNAVWGGGVRRAPEVMAALDRAGFTDIRALPGQAMIPILARRA